MVAGAAVRPRRATATGFTARDLGVAALALLLFLVFGTFAYRITPDSLGRVISTSATASSAPASCGPPARWRSRSPPARSTSLLRVPVRFTRLGEDEIDRTLELHAAHRRAARRALLVANGDKAVFRFDDRGFCLYRTIGPYLVVFSDPVVRSGPRSATRS